MRKKIALLLASLMALVGLGVVGAASPAAAAEVLRDRTGFCYNTQDGNYRIKVYQQYAYSTNGVNVRPYGTTVTQQRKIAGVWQNALWAPLSGGGYSAGIVLYAKIWATDQDYFNGATPIWDSGNQYVDDSNTPFTRVYFSNLYNTQRFEKMYVNGPFLDPNCGYADSSIPF